MTSPSFENSGPARTAERILMLLKTRGPQSAALLGAALGTTSEAARQHLVRLAEQRLVEAASEPHGVGRPTQVWSLTEDGQRRFPDTHAELTVQLLRTVRQTLGEEALERLISVRERKTRDAYAREMGSAGDLEARVTRLAELRDREGYMAEARREGEAFVLIENHCPICAAAAECQGFCRAELQVFQEVLGPDTRVERLEHIQSGARRCAYRITPA